MDQTEPPRSLRPNSLRGGPDANGRFGTFGGRFVAETLMPLVLELEQAYEAARIDPEFKRELDHLLKHYVGRPSPLWFAERLTQHCGGAKIYLKREELNHTGAHKVNSCVGQILLARRMGRTRIIAETGAGQHGVATATVCGAVSGCPAPSTWAPGGYRATEAQCLPHEPAGRGSKTQRLLRFAGTLKDATNEATARLGRQCRGHLLHHRFGGGAASLSRHGARLPDA